MVELAHAAGMVAGLVTTAKANHATPGAFSAHTGSRDDGDVIDWLHVGAGGDARKIDHLVSHGASLLVHMRGKGRARAGSCAGRERKKEKGPTRKSTPRVQVGHVPLHP